MAFIRRLSKLVTADAHAVLDLMEEPKALLKQAIREMSQEIENLKFDIESICREKELLSNQEQRLKELTQDIDSNLDLCLSTENPSLARNLVKKKLVVKQQQESIYASKKVSERLLQDLQKKLRESEGEYETVRMESELLLPHKKEVTSFEQRYSLNLITEEDVDIALLHELTTRQRS